MLLVVSEQFSSKSLLGQAMEQESEGKAMLALEFDKKVRKEASLGFQQVRNIENRLRFAPQGVLGKVDGSSEAQALRSTIIGASATIVASFSNVISLLSTPPPPASRTNENFGVEDRSAMGNRAESPIVSTAPSDLTTPPHSPRRVHPAVSSSSRLMLSPAMSAHSGSGLSEGGSPPIPTSSPIALDSDGEGGGQFRRPIDAANGAADPAELSEQRALSRKRKFMPKYSCKQRAVGTDPSNDGPPDDGHTWRKYGQKDILGSNFPRSYYRCTHKIELGCPATKYVQRSDEERAVFDVTYRGNHTCHVMQQQAWPFGLSPELVALALSAKAAHHQISPSDPSSSAAPVHFPFLMENHRSNPSSAPAGQTHGMPSSSRDDNLLLNRSSTLPPPPVPVSRFAASVSDAPPTSTAMLNMPSSEIMAASGFGLSPPSMELELRQKQQDHSNSVKLETSSPQPFNQVNRDNLFGPGSNLLNLLLATSKPKEEGRCKNMEEEPHRRVAVDMKLHAELPSSRSNNSGRLEGSPEARYVERWGEETELNDFQSSQLGAQCFGGYHAISEMEISSFKSTGSAAEKGHIGGSTMEADDSELVSIVHPSTSPFTAGYMMDSPVGLIDYDTYLGTNFYGCAN